MTGKRKLPIAAFIAATLLGMVAVMIGTWLMTGKVYVTGGAHLANGQRLKIIATGRLFESGVAISSHDETTTIESGRYVINFEHDDILVNGNKIGEVPTGSHYELRVDSTDGVEFRMRGKVIAKCD